MKNEMLQEIERSLLFNDIIDRGRPWVAGSG